MVQLAKAPEKLIVSDRDTQISCYYVNSTKRIQVIQIKDSSTSSWKKVVFSGQRIIFYASKAAQLEVYSQEGNKITSIKQIPCDRLQIRA